MKTIFRAILAVAIAGAPLLAGQDPQTEKEKQKKEEMKKQTAPSPAQEPQPEEKPKPKAEKPRQEPAPPPKEPKQEEKQQQKEQQKQEKQQKEESKQNNKQQRQTTQQNTQTQAGKGGQARGMKIPDPKFRASFGHEHHFRVPSSARDDRRFRYGGYWFEVVEVWPAGWSFDDDCYVEEDGDDYYLVDFIHPEVRVLVIVVEG